MSRPRPQLRLIRETAVVDLLPAGSPRRLEASGVLAVDGHFYVIFDNLRSVAVIDQNLDRVDENTMVPTGSANEQAYEDIARDPVTGHLYLLIEAAPRGRGYRARVEEYDADLRFRSAGWLDLSVTRPNKGIEGLTCVHRDGVTYLLGLSEATGRVHVFRRGRRNWKRVDTVKLPRTLRFADYSSLSVAAERVAVVSQESSALWLGHFRPGTFTVAGPGDTYLFPRNPAGEVVYCNVEGVSWLRDDEFVVVSDRAKNGRQGRRCRAKDQSLHIFALPGGAG
jgi:hypothetical protein